MCIMPTKIPNTGQNTRMTGASQCVRKPQNPPASKSAARNAPSPFASKRVLNNASKHVKLPVEHEESPSVSSNSEGNSKLSKSSKTSSVKAGSDLAEITSSMSNGSSDQSSSSPPPQGIKASAVKVDSKFHQVVKTHSVSQAVSKRMNDASLQKSTKKKEQSSVSSTSSDEKHCELDVPICKLYTVNTRLGKGAYGIVWEAYEKCSGNKVALKKIFDAFRNDTDAQRTYREIMFLREFGSHPNIIRLLNVHKAVNNMDIYLVFPFMEHDLHRLIKELPHMLTDDSIKLVFYQTTKAVKYLHSGEVIHRDLKPANILLDNFLNVKVGDFGLARSLSITDDVVAETNPVMTDYVATRWYRPPEILLSCPVYTKGVDMWSLGCILAEMILKVPLFPGGSTVHQVETIMAHIDPPTEEEVQEVCSHSVHSTLIESAMVNQKKSLEQIFESCHPETVDIIKKFLVFNPSKRLTAEETLEHPFLANHRRIGEEVVMDHPVSPPLSDFVQLPMCQYRSVIYDLIKVRQLRTLQPQNFVFDQQPSALKVTGYNNRVDERISSTSSPVSKELQMPKKPDSFPTNFYTQFQYITGKADTVEEAVRHTDFNLGSVKNISRLSRKSTIVPSGSKSLNEMTQERVRNNTGSKHWRSNAKIFDKTATKLQSEEALSKFSGDLKKKLAHKHNSSPCIGSTKPPGPDGDGLSLGVPYPYINSDLSIGLPDRQYSNQREYSHGKTGLVSYTGSDLQGIDRKFLELYGNNGDLEEEIRCIENQVRANKIGSTNTSYWITDFTNNLNKNTASNKSTVKSTHHKLSKYQGSGQNPSNHHKLPNKTVTRLPDIIQSWNQVPDQVARPEERFSHTDINKARRSSYFQDPPLNFFPKPTMVSKASPPRLPQDGLKYKQYKWYDDDSYQQRRVQSSQSNQSSCISNSPVSFSQNSSPLQKKQLKYRHYDSYSQTHGTISASDLSELKSSLGFYKS